MNRHISVAEPVLGDEERENIAEVLDSGRFLQGPFVEDFEEKWAEYVGTTHAVAVVNGTAAIQLALNAFGLQPGDEVIVPSLTFGSTATAVVHQAGIPIFADIERETYNLSPDDLKRCLSNRTKAVIPVHLYGHPAEMDAIVAFADKHDLVVIEDAAQSHGARYKGNQVGSIGDAGCFSFYATKNITTGEGGIITTDDEVVAERVRKLRNHGMRNRDEHVALGFNYRMNELQGAIGVAQVDRLDELNARRREISMQLFDALSDVDWLEPATVREYVEHAYFWAPFEIDTESIGMPGKEVWRALLNRGVETRHRYITPLYNQQVFTNHRGFNSEFPWSESTREHNYSDLYLPNVEAVVGRTIGLPNHPGLQEEDIEYVIETIREF